MKNGTILMMSLLIACLALTVTFISMADADDEGQTEAPIEYASELTTFSGTASELWPNEYIVEYDLDGPVIIQITPDSVDGYDYEVYRTFSNVMHIDVVNGGVDILIAETMYTNIILKRTDSQGHAECKTLFISVTTMTQDGDIIYGSKSDVDVHISPERLYLETGQTSDLTITLSPDRFYDYVQDTYWTSFSQEIATISSDGEIGHSFSETVQGVSGGTTKIWWMANILEPGETQEDDPLTYTISATAIVHVERYGVAWMSQDNSRTLEVDWDVAYGDTPSFDGEEPTKAATTQYTYTFVGWSTERNSETGVPASSLPVVTQNTVYYAAFSKTLRTYTVTWESNTGDTLEIDLDVDYGTVPSYDGEEPTKAATAQYTYRFVGWSTNPYRDPGVPASSLPGVTGDVTYYAVFIEEFSTYTVTWMSQDGNTILETDPIVIYGTTPTYDGNTPTRAATTQYTYTFVGWSTSPNSISGVEASLLPAVTGDVTYYASFSASANESTSNPGPAQNGSSDLFGGIGLSGDMLPIIVVGAIIAIIAGFLVFTRL